MTPKWTIRKFTIHSNGSRSSRPWLAFPPGVAIPETHDSAIMFAHATYSTFHRALVCVESQIRKARTVEVELPKIRTIEVVNHEYLGDDWSVMVSRGNVNAVIRTIHGVVRIRNENLKPLALHLLALHYEKENR